MSFVWVIRDFLKIETTKQAGILLYLKNDSNPRQNLNFEFWAPMQWLMRKFDSGLFLSGFQCRLNKQT